MYARKVDGNIALAIASNKQDADAADWRVTHAEATSLATATGATHFRTSARTGDGVDALFRDAAQRGLAARSGRSELPGAALGTSILSIQLSLNDMCQCPQLMSSSSPL